MKICDLEFASVFHFAAPGIAHFSTGRDDKKKKTPKQRHKRGQEDRQTTRDTTTMKKKSHDGMPGKRPLR